MGTVDFASEVTRLCAVEAFMQPDRVQVAVPNARNILMQGLRHFIGDSAQWLPEYDAVADWLTSNDGRGLLCAGNVGRGKTVLCAKVIPCVLHACLHRIVTPFTARELGQNIDKALQSHLILIDDIGTESETVRYGNHIMAVPLIVDDMERRGGLLIMTTNLGYDELQAKYGLRTTDRIRALCKVVNFAGTSLRGLKQGE